MQTLKQGAYAVKFLDPAQILSRLGIKNGMAIAHFGCGAGHFTFAAAQIVGETGRVWAFDVLPERIEHIESQIKVQGIVNISAQVANLEERGGSKMNEESVDWVFLVNILHQNEHKSRILGEAKRILKTNGHILLIEWKDESNLIGPQKKFRASREEIIKIARKHELKITEIKVSDFHWGMVLTK